MDVAIDQIEPDGKATSPKESLELVEWALEEMGRVLVDELFGKLNAKNAQLAQEAKEQVARATTLRSSLKHLQPRVEAHQRILAGEVDKALSEGRDDDVEAKRQESAALEQSLREIQAQAEASECRVWDLKAEQKQNYRAVFERTYPEIRQSIVSAEIALATLLNKVWGDLLRYEAGSFLLFKGQSFVRDRHRRDLTPHDTGPEARHFTSLQGWFGGRR